jgi:hypothetical protein
MGWKYLEQPKTMLARKSLVTEFVNMEPAPYDRPLSERRMAVYERILKAGEFRTVTWASVVCKETNNTYRVNGKHTATMLSKMDPLPEFHVTVERYQADTLQDVTNLYNTFDSTLASRTTNDINLAFARTIRDLDNVPVRLINLTVSAASYLKWGEGQKKIPPAERAEELMDAYPFTKWLYEIVPTGGASQNGHLCRAPVVTAMKATYDRMPVKAKEFWTLVKDESAPDRDDPTRVLTRYLLRAALAGGGPASNAAHGKKLVDFREMYVKCLHAWNAWRKGETTSLNYYAKADIPSVSK